MVGLVFGLVLCSVILVALLTWQPIAELHENPVVIGDISQGGHLVGVRFTIFTRQRTFLFTASPYIDFNFLVEKPYFENPTYSKPFDMPILPSNTGALACLRVGERPFIGKPLSGNLHFEHFTEYEMT